MLINTGNILSLNELKLKAGQNTEEEVSDNKRQSFYL